VNTYVREDQILPHLAAIAMLLASPAEPAARGNRSPVQVTGPAGTATLIDELRARSVTLTYDPDKPDPARRRCPVRHPRQGCRHQLTPEPR
jgi:hypothetical protein